MPEEEFESLVASILEVCNEHFIPILKGTYPFQIRCMRSGNREFNAKVETEDGAEFTVTINDGLFYDLLSLPYYGLANPDLDLEMEDLSLRLFGDPGFKHDLYDVVSRGSVIFVIFHELCHIFRRHLHYLLAVSGKSGQTVYREIGYDFPSPPNGWNEFIKANFVKMVELDADTYAGILLYTMSTEVLALVSEQYESSFPAWRTDPENVVHRQCANQLMIYAASIAISGIEARQTKAYDYPSPFTRIINLFDTFNQEAYKSQGLLDNNNPSVGIEYLPNSKDLKDLMNDFVFPTFVISVDFVIQACRTLEDDLIVKYGVTDDALIKHLLEDFTQLLTQLRPAVLHTRDAEEFALLRIHKPMLNRQFNRFLKLRSENGI